MPKSEFKVVWQREGQGRKRAIYQTLIGAQEFIDKLDNVEEDRWTVHPNPPEADSPERSEWDRMHAPFVVAPTIYSREVGEWTEVVP